MRTSAIAMNHATILLVDDEPDMLQNFVRFLTPQRYHCLTAQTGIEALGLMNQRPPDLIITDLHLPGMDGVEIARYAREASPPIPVILVSANPLGAQRASDAGIVFFLPKPFEHAALLETVRRALMGGGPAPPERR